MICCNHDCNQGRDCPARRASGAEAGRSLHSDMARAIEQIEADLRAILGGHTHVVAKPAPRAAARQYLAPGVLDGPHRRGRPRSARRLGRALLILSVALIALAALAVSCAANGAQPAQPHQPDRGSLHA